MKLARTQLSASISSIFASCRSMGRRTGTLGGALALTLASSGAAAQQAAPPAPPAKAAQSEQIDVIVVTAQKRKEDPNKVALSISAIRGSDLQAQHVGDFADLTRAIPNISFSGGNGAGAGLSNIEIRGISSSAGSSTVGVYLDDVSMTVGNLYSMGSAEPKFFDTERVEVLRGPQGTLYGASSMGGTIKFIANQPDLKDREVSAYSEVSSTGGGGTNYRANMVANLPLIADQLALRIGVQVGRTSGYIDQVSAATGALVAQGINSSNDQELRLGLKWSPTRALTIAPSLFYQRVDSHDIDAIYTALPGNRTSKLMREPGLDRLLVPSLTIGYDLGSADLTSVSSLFQRSFDRSQDASAYNSQFLPVFLTDAAPAGLADTLNGLPSIVALNNQVRQFSQELRIASKPYDRKGSPWTWVGGVYLANLHTNVTENDPIFGVNAAFAKFGVAPTDATVLAGALPVGFPADNSYFSARHYRDKQSALFGEANYYFSPALHATVGMRYLKATNELAQNNDLFFAGGAHSTNPGLSTTAFTPKFALAWELDSAHTLYASSGKGFRLGGGNVFIPSSVCLASGDLQKLGLTEAPGTFGADSLWSYEVGNKSRFFGNRLSINADVFYVNWKNIQQQVNLPGCGYNYATNVGSATSRGVEIEIKAKPMSGLLLGLSGGYTKAELSDSIGFLRDGIPGAVQGAPIEGVPKYNGAFTAQYNFSVFDGMGAVARGAIHWVGSSHGTLDPANPDFLRPAYHTADASIGISFAHADLTLFAKNLLNDDTLIQHPNVASVSTGYRVAPRSIGVSLSGSF